MDRLFVTNIEDNEVLYESSKDKENVRSDPPKRGSRAFLNALSDEQPSSK